MYREQCRVLVRVDRTLERFRGADMEVLAGPIRDAWKLVFEKTSV